MSGGGRADGGENDKMIPRLPRALPLFSSETLLLSAVNLFLGLVCETSLAVVRLFRLIPPSRIIKSTVHSSLISRFSTLTLKPTFNGQHFQAFFVLPLDSVTSQLPLRSERQQV